MGLDFNALRGRYDHYKEHGVDDESGGGNNRKQVMNFSDYDDVNFWKPEAGPHGVDIIPYVVSSKKHPTFKEGDTDCVLQVHVHRFVGPNKDNFICMKETYGKSCPICEEMESRHNAIMEEEMAKGKSQRDAWITAKNHKSVKALKPKHRVFYNIIDVDDREKGVMMFEAPYSWFEQPLASQFTTRCARKPSTPFFFDPEKGSTIIVKSTDEEYDGHKFVKSEPTGFEDRDVVYEADIVESAYSLDAMLNIPAYDDVKNAFLGIATEDDEEFFEVPKKEETPKTVKFSVPKPQVKVEVKEDKPEEVKEETREERMARIAAKKAAPKLKCPVEGGVFGDDYCAYDECEDCDLVSECSEASDIGI